MHRFLLASLAIALSSLSARAAIPQAEHDALVALYQSTNGDSWTSHSGWLGAAGTECSWQGISCDPTQSNVAVINLQSNNLAGPIPSGIGALSALQLFNLDFNAITGSIPPQLGSLHALRRIDLWGNQLQGALPAELANLSSLTAIDLTNNQLSGPIDPLIGLPSLQILGLGQNQFSGPIPAAIGSMSTLTSISLDLNQFSGPIPGTIGSLTNLVALDLRANRFSGPIPSSLGELLQLTDLALSSNQLTGMIPPELGSLTKLQYLDLDRNALSGAIPDSLQNLQQLVEFLGFNNQISGPIPAWIGTLTKLQRFEFSSTQLSGPLPAGLTQLANLQILNLEQCQLTGTLPADIGSLHSLVTLYLDENEFDGVIPPSIGDLSSLQTLVMSRNALTGELPPEIGALHQLKVLSVGDNELDGVIPAEIGNLAALASLNLAHNHFSGTVPAVLGSLSRLQFIDVSGNALRGPLPQELMNLTSLVDHSSDFGHNLFYSSDAALSAFLDQKQVGSVTWERTQTVPPSNVHVVSVTDRSATIAWDTIPFVEFDGGYQVVASTTPGGPPAAIATTPSKYLGSIVVYGLAPSTQYFFSVATVTNAWGAYKNLLVSDPTPPLSAATTAAVVSPPQVVVTVPPRGLIEVSGLPANQDSVTLTNYGDASVALTVSATAPYFSASPPTVSLGARQSATVTLTALPQPPGFYSSGFLQVRGEATDLDVSITLLSVAQSTGTANAIAVYTRIESAGAPGSTDSGTAVFRNIGTAALSGILLSDSPWVQPPNTPITILPGQSASLTFQINRALKPSQAGALSATLSLLYVAGGSPAAKTLGPLDGGASGVSVTTVTVVDTTKPSTLPATPPALGGAIGFFVPGLASLVENGVTLNSDLSIANISTTNAISDLQLFFALPGGANSEEASVGTIATGKGVSLVNVAQSVYGQSNANGSLQIRSANIAELVALARTVGASGGTSTIGDLPVFRSDQSAKTGETTVLTGVRGGADLFIQETANQPASVRVDFLDSTGAAAGAPLTESVPAQAMVVVDRAGPSGAATAIVTNNGPGEIAAYARIIDPSGDTWSVVDWRRVQNYDGSSALRIPFAEGTAASRHRAVATEVSAGSTTTVTLFDPETSDAIVQIDTIDPGGKTTSGQIVVPSRQTMTVSNIESPNSTGQLVITPRRGDVYATARDSHPSSGGTVGAAIPVISATSGLRLGQSRMFSGIEDSTSATIAAAAPATYSSALGLAETGGSTATVSVSVAISDTSSLTAPLLSQTFTLGPYEQLLLTPLLRALAGPSRDSAFGDLHGLKLQIQVTGGSGAVVPFIVVSDNGSGDTWMRLQ